MIEYMMDILWMALAAMPFAVGMAQPPQPIGAGTINKSTKAVSGANQADVASGVLAGVNLMTDTGEVLNAAELKTLRGQDATAVKRIGVLQGLITKGGKPSKIAQWQAELERLTTAKTERDTKIATLASPDFAANRLRGAFSEQYGMRDNIVSRLGASLAPTSEYARMQDAYGRGISAQTVGQRAAALAQANAAGMGQVADVRAREVGAGALGDTLMGRAVDMARSQGMLTPQASRDAIQSARQGMAARGMATGSAGLAAELLNRDRYSRQRMFQDLGFAQGIQGQDLERQLANAGNVLRADQGNQQTQFGREQIISGNQQQANLANMQAANQMAQYNTTLGATTDQFNAQALDSTNRFNMGLLGTSAQMADQERLRQVNTATDQYNFAQATDPRTVAMSLGAPYANLTGSTQGGLNVASFNQNMQASMYNSMMNNNAAMQAANMQAGAARDAGMMGMIGNIGQGVLGAAGMFALSDKREKTEIKPLGKAGSILGLKTYSYKYKGDKKERIGVMAQDVQKVLPEAVAEVNYKGKKRLAIKPAVIGAALAEELAAQAA